MGIDVWNEQNAKIAELTAKRDALAQENKQLVEALEKIADGDAYNSDGMRYVARQSLATMKEKP